MQEDKSQPTVTFLYVLSSWAEEQILSNSSKDPNQVSGISLQATFAGAIFL